MQRIRIKGVRPQATIKRDDLDEYLTSLLTDGEYYFVYVALWSEVYCVEPHGNSLRVSKEIWEGEELSREKVGSMSVLLTDRGWQQMVVPESKRWGANNWKNREATTMTQHEDRFRKASQIIKGTK